MHNVFLDIETLPVQCPERRAKLIAEAKPPANMSKPETIAKWREENADAIIAKTSFDPAAGHICCLSWAIEDSPISTAEISNLDEEESLLRQFFGALPQTGMCRFIGHYISGFDLRFIMCRAIVLGVKVPALWPREPDKPGNQQAFDTMHKWAGTRADKDKRISLDRLCEALGIESPKGELTGAGVAQAWQDGRFDEIAQYNRRDVEAVREVFRKFEAVGLA